MKKQLAVISKKVYMNEDNYASFLADFESKHGAFDKVIVHRCSNRSDEVILEIISNID